MQRGYIYVAFRMRYIVLGLLRYTRNDVTYKAIAVIARRNDEAIPIKKTKQLNKNYEFIN